MIYAAFGTASTTPAALAQMQTLATMLALRGATLRTSPTSRAPGGWAAYEALCDGAKAVGGSVVPRTPTIWDKALHMAGLFDPLWSARDLETVQQFEAAACLSMLGDTLDTLPHMVLCYTPDGERGPAQCILDHYGAALRVFNLARPGADADMWAWLAQL